MDFKDIGIRALKTAVQVFIASLPFTLLTDITQPALVSAGVAAASAGVSVVMNAILQWSQS